tara:strand:+ start:76 stop:375 length:300 start_codon:yes stop_codon:yes gene_type:complete
MAFKMKGSPAKLGTIEGTSAFKDRKIKKAKKLVKRNVKHTTVDSPKADKVSDKKFNRSEKKITKAIEILRGKGYSEEEIEQMTGAGGYEAAMDWATSKD